MRFGISQTLFALVTLTASAGSALADEPAPAATTRAAAPNAAGVSEVDGQLVKVGDRTQFENDVKKWNVSTNPLGLIYGSYGLSVGYTLSNNIALRADVNYIDALHSDDSALELGLSAPIYFRKTYLGLFIEPGVALQRLHVAAGTNDAGEAVKEATVNMVGPEMLIGYHWNWDSGLNVAIAAGVGRNFNTSDEKSNDDRANQDFFAAGYLRVGYAF
jgi:hypothetical protein